MNLVAIRLTSRLRDVGAVNRLEYLAYWGGHGVGVSRGKAVDAYNWTTSFEAMDSRLVPLHLLHQEFERQDSCSDPAERYFCTKNNTQL